MPQGGSKKTASVCLNGPAQGQDCDASPNSLIFFGVVRKPQIPATLKQDSFPGPSGFHLPVAALDASQRAAPSLSRSPTLAVPPFGEFERAPRSNIDGAAWRFSALIGDAERSYRDAIARRFTR